MKPSHSIIVGKQSPPQIETEENGNSKIDYSQIHMMSHSLAFQVMQDRQKSNRSRGSNNSSALRAGFNIKSGNLIKGVAGSNGKVHMDAMRPRTFDP